MKVSGVKAPPEEHWKYCPYCMNPMSRIEVIKRKTKRIVVCKKCRKTIDKVKEEYIKNHQ